MKGACSILRLSFKIGQRLYSTLCCQSPWTMTTRRTTRRCTLRLCLCLLLMAPLLGHAGDLYLADGSLLGAPSPAPQGAQPVLFVHGHKLLWWEPEPSYGATWTVSLDTTLRSFGETLAHPGNADLHIEPYYLNFGVHNRSIVEDAHDIDDAVNRILVRHHDPAELPLDESHPSRVQVAIIAYSKGTISTRLYLKSLQQQQYTLPPPRPAFHPVSEFIAIAPPNHGLAIQPGATTNLALSTLLTSLFATIPGQQLSNGFRGGTCDRLLVPLVLSSLNFMEKLNGHPMADSHLSHFHPSAPYPSEAPGSRGANDPLASGTLYVTLYDAGNRDSAGGEAPVINDCTTSQLYGARLQGRKLARNLAAHAVNVPVPGIPGTDPDGVREALTVHQNTVHYHRVICLALYTAAHHTAPCAAVTCPLTVDGLPLIP